MKQKTTNEKCLLKLCTCLPPYLGEAAKTVFLTGGGVYVTRPQVNHTMRKGWKRAMAMRRYFLLCPVSELA
jgi:hypothetical protein